VFGVSAKKAKLSVFYCKGQTYCFVIYAFVCILPEKAVPNMTYTVSGGMLNPTHECWLEDAVANCSQTVSLMLAQFRLLSSYVGFC